METLNKKLHPKPARKIKILQFGEGNFLRGFSDWIIQKMNESISFEAGVVVVQPLETGRVDDLAEQDGLYTLYTEGIENGEAVKKKEIIDVLDDFINPYADYKKFLSYARSRDLETVISNTTETGIALDATDTDFSACPKSFPGKLLAFLYERYVYFKGDITKGLNVIPCELIDDNAKELKRILAELARVKGFGAGFIKWLTESNRYVSTLVDRIVPGFPRDETAALNEENGYIDSCAVKAEVFHLWVLEGDPRVKQAFPADKCGLNVVYAPDIKPYKERKVRILNGSHTALVPIAYLSGYDAVRDGIGDKFIGEFLSGLIFKEINPTIKLPADELNVFADSVLERFQNPFIRHELMSIALNSTAKFRARLVPTLCDHIKIKGKAPRRLLFALAAFILFHKGKRGGQTIALNDDPGLLEKWRAAWGKYGADTGALVKEILSWAGVWGTDINALGKGITKSVSGYLDDMIADGMLKSVEKFLKKARK